MAYFISDDAKDLLKDLRNFCEKEMRTQVYDAEKAGYAGEADDSNVDAILEGLQEMGIGILAIPEEKGGPGLSRLDRAALVEEVAKYDSGIAMTFMANELALDSLEVAGNEEQKDRCYEMRLQCSSQGRRDY